MILLGMIHPSKSLANKTDFNPIQKRHFQGFSQMDRGGGGRCPVTKISQISPIMIKLETVVPYLKKIQIIYK